MQILGPKRLNRALGRNLVDKGGATDLFSSAPLDLRFALQKTLDPRVTFTRASTGTYVGADGLVKLATTNEARFDHNPTTGESLGLLVEEPRTNSTLYSQDFGNVAIGKNNATVTDNTATSPAGDSTADKVVEDSANSEHGVTLPNFSYAASTAYTFTIFAKAVERNRLRVLLPESAFGQNKVAWFDLNNGSVIQTSGTGITSSVSAYTNGWYRCAISATTTTATAGTAAQLRLVNSGTTVTYTGDNTSGLLLWGAQLEAGAFATSYIPTTTSTATRTADVASITGTNFSSWHNQTEGTVFGQFLRTASTNSQQGRVFSFNNGTNTNALEIYQTGASNPSAQITATTAQALWTPSGFTVGTSIKEVLGYQLNNSNASFNGSAETLDTACNIPTVTQARIGDRQDGVRNLNGTIQRLTYWPVRLADTTLQSITSP